MDKIKTMNILRADAIQRGMQDLAIAYGWSAIRLKGEELLTLAAYRDALAKKSGGY